MLEAREPSRLDARYSHYAMAQWDPATSMPFWLETMEFADFGGDLKAGGDLTFSVNTPYYSKFKFIIDKLQARTMRLSSDILAVIMTGAVPLRRGLLPSGLSANTNVASSLGGYPKRLLDIVVSALALILLAPLMLVVAALIKLKLGGPVIFTHQRVGFNGVAFPCLKFRTMVIDAEAVLKRHLDNDPAAAQEWRETRKLKNDPRVTPLGKLLRKSSIDELPQLFNVLRGDMSCVGPRPIVSAELMRYAPHEHEYLSVRPGLTGLWQVSGRSRLTYRERVALDCIYVRRWSLWLDISLLLRTIPAVLAFEEAA